MSIDTPARIAVIGAGPIGLETALYARFLGYDVDVYERADVAANVGEWRHVSMFSPFGMNRSSLGLAALNAHDAAYEPPGDDAVLTGGQWCKLYLLPLSETDLLADSVHSHVTVAAVGREGLIKTDDVGSPRRAERPFRILLRDEQDRERIATADVVIDTSGVYRNPNPLGSGGIPAVGETALRDKIDYWLPDVLGRDRERFARRHTLVVGSGYSAATTFLALFELAELEEGTRVTWATRRELAPDAEGPIGRIADDRLPARDGLARAANDLARSGNSHVEFYPKTAVDAIDWDEVRRAFDVRLIGSEERQLQFDFVVAHTGFHPDNSLYRELQVHECYATGGPMKLATQLLAEQSADCLNQPAGGRETLVCPEPNFYILGSKSYGRNSRFLYSAGLDQVRQLFTLIGGREDLDLYAGVRHLMS
jgi:thioredoxin reductase